LSGDSISEVHANQLIICVWSAARAKDRCRIAQRSIAPHTHSEQYLGMTIYRRSEESERRIMRCAACEGTVLAETAGFRRVDANTACASCGMTLADSPFRGGDYYAVIMRVGRPLHSNQPAKAMLHSNARTLFTA
jgi:hypothetical protein